jgi:hypothetical protein
MKTPRAESVILEEAQREKTVLPDLAGRPIIKPLREVLLKTFPPFLIIRLLEAYAGRDVTSDKIAAVTGGQGPLAAVLHKKLMSLSPRETLPSMEATIVLLGMEQSRNLIMQTLTGFELNYAKAAERDCPPEGGASAAWIFAAGLVFDYLAQVLTDKDTMPAHVAAAIKTARVAQKLANAAGERNLVSLVTAAALLSDVGKLYLAAADPAYLAFMKSATNSQIPRSTRLQIERKTWQIDHTIVGALACETFHFPHAVGLAVQFHHFPKLAQARDPGAHRIAQIVSLATRMVKSPKRIVDAADPIVETWFGPEMAGTGLARKIVIEASTAL